MILVYYIHIASWHAHCSIIVVVKGPWGGKTFFRFWCSSWSFHVSLRFRGFFSVTRATFVYDPLGHGARGWLKDLGALEFAGGIVVHTRSGVSALLLSFSSVRCYW